MARRAVRAVIVYGLLAALSLAGGAALVAVASEYGYHPNRDTAVWAAREPAYAIVGSCRRCHEPEANANAAAVHAGVSCQACHGPLAGHDGTETAVVEDAPGAEPAEGVATGGLVGAAREAGEPVCLTCHEAAIGRPAEFPVVSSVTHGPVPPCTACHAAHDPSPQVPPDILHPLDRLPECSVCHRADGIRPLPARHPTWEGDCRACHRSAQPLGT